MNGNWEYFPPLNPNNIPHYINELDKYEREQDELIYSDKYILISKIKNIIKITLQNLSFEGNGSDIGMATISAILSSIGEGINRLTKLGYIAPKVGPLQYVFFVFDVSIVFTYNQGTKDWYRGIAATTFSLFTLIITILVGFFISTWWLALIIAALIAFIAALFANSQWGKSALELISEKIQELAETIKANLEKAKAFFEANEQDYYKPFRNKDFMKNLCEDLTCKDFSEQSLRDLLAYSGYKRDNNEWQTFVYYHTRLSLQDIFDRENGTFKASYKAMRDTAFEKGVESQKEARLTYNASKPKITSV
ncbi:hypothetical protein [Helicobacter typhlonius]|uniref:hypothetical protein n=1 Tax=Helicobacter typhlonius TaxID=76936 RepID=UPI002FE4074D